MAEVVSWKHLREAVAATRSQNLGTLAGFGVLLILTVLTDLYMMAIGLRGVSILAAEAVDAALGPALTRTIALGIDAVVALVSLSILKDCQWWLQYRSTFANLWASRANRLPWPDRIVIGCAAVLGLILLVPLWNVFDPILHTQRDSIALVGLVTRGILLAATVSLIGFLAVSILAAKQNRHALIWLGMGLTIIFIGLVLFAPPSFGANYRGAANLQALSGVAYIVLIIGLGLPQAIHPDAVAVRLDVTIDDSDTYTEYTSLGLPDAIPVPVLLTFNAQGHHVIVLEQRLHEHFFRLVDIRRQSIPALDRHLKIWNIAVLQKQVQEEFSRNDGKGYFQASGTIHAIPIVLDDGSPTGGWDQRFGEGVISLALSLIFQNRSIKEFLQKGVGAAVSQEFDTAILENLDKLKEIDSVNVTDNKLKLDDAIDLIHRFVVSSPLAILSAPIESVPGNAVHALDEAIEHLTLRRGLIDANKEKAHAYIDLSNRILSECAAIRKRLEGIWQNEIARQFRNGRGAVDQSDDAIALMQSIGLGLDVTKVEPIGEALGWTNKLSEVFQGYVAGYEQARSRVNQRIESLQQLHDRILADAAASPAPTPIQLTVAQGAAKRLAPRVAPLEEGIVVRETAPKTFEEPT